MSQPSNYAEVLWTAGVDTNRVSRRVAVFLLYESGVPVNVISDTGVQGITGHAHRLQARLDAWALFVMMLEFPAIRLGSRIIHIPGHVMLPLILIFCIAGSFAINSNYCDVCAGHGTAVICPAKIRRPPGTSRAECNSAGRLEEAFVQSLTESIFSDRVLQSRDCCMPRSTVHLRLVLAGGVPGGITLSQTAC